MADVFEGDESPYTDEGDEYQATDFSAANTSKVNMTERQGLYKKTAWSNSVSQIPNMPELTEKQLRRSQTKLSIPSMAKIRKIILPRKKEIIIFDKDSDDGDSVENNKIALSKTVQIYNKKMEYAT